MKIRKAIIPAAGLGTRFLPATKAQPKEMLPVVDKPTIQYIVEEAVASGIEDILIITGRGKRAIEDHFDKAYELEQELEKKGKNEWLEQIQNIANMVDIHYVRQKDALGLGHAVYCARKFIGNEAFALLLGDIIVESVKPCLRQLIDLYDRVGGNIIGVQEVAKKDINKYGIVAVNKNDSNIYEITNLVEKPKPEHAPSNLAILGRYIIHPEIFNILEKLPPGVGGEIQLTDALKELGGLQKMYAYPIDGINYDVGDKLGYLRANIEYALMRNELKDEFRNYLLELVRKLG